MLAKRYRLHRRSDVQRVRQQGRRFRHPLAILLVTRSPVAMNEMPDMIEKNGRLPSRFAFVASRRVGSAVARNRAKRLLREAIHVQMNSIHPGWDGVLIARQATATASFSEVDKAVASLLSRAKIRLPQQSK